MMLAPICFGGDRGRIDSTPLQRWSAGADTYRTACDFMSTKNFWALVVSALIPLFSLRYALVRHFFAFSENTTICCGRAEHGHKLNSPGKCGFRNY
jgi:hypothetical protein